MRRNLDLLLIDRDWYDQCRMPDKSSTAPKDYTIGYFLLAKPSSEQKGTGFPSPGTGPRRRSSGRDTTSEPARYWR